MRRFCFAVFLVGLPPVIAACSLALDGGAFSGGGVGVDARSPATNSEAGSPATDSDAGSPVTNSDAGSSTSTDAATESRTDANSVADGGGPLTKDAGSAVLTTWTAYGFKDQNRLGTCNGARYVAYNTKYALFVGVVLCNANRYKIYLATSETETFYEIADGSGGGQDQCEFVSPSFTLGTDGSMNGGSCPACAFDYAGTGTTGGQDVGAFSRSVVGEQPVFYPVWPSQSYTGHWFECGVAIPSQGPR